MLRQSLSQKQLQKLSPLQIQLMYLIQLPTSALEQRIKEELQENPALEEGEEETEEVQDSDETDLTEETETEKEEKEDEINIEEFLQDDEIPDYKTQVNNSSPDDERKTIPMVASASFQEMLMNQAGLCNLDERNEKIAVQIIGSIDDDGYLRRPLNQISNDLAFSQNITAEESELQKILEVIQTFDPPGIAARDLKECLLIQLKRKDITEPDIALSIRVIENYFDEFSNKSYGKITRELTITEEDLKVVISEVVKLNPKPGDTYSDSQKSEQHIIPDFIISNNEGKLELSLNSKNAPELRVSRAYREMLQRYIENKKAGVKDKEAELFIRQKLESARWFIDAITERQNTLLRTMNAIMNYQYDYFLTGDETLLKPMVLKDISAVSGYDVSTVSRVSSVKYVQTPHGTFQVKYFFSERVKTQSGGEASAREVKRIIMNLIEEEDKKNPLTDENLLKILKEKNYQLARRTIAKYRELLNIPSARMRKEI